MATFGITAQGLIVPRLVDIQTEINNTLIATFGAEINLDPNSNFGQLSGIFAERESLIWQAMQDVYNSQYPDTAFGASLDNVGAIEGNPRLKALASTITNVKLFGTPGTPVPGTFQASVQNAPNSIFQINSAVTLGAGQNCIQLITFALVPGVGQWGISINGVEIPLFNYNDPAATIQAAIQAVTINNYAPYSGTIVTGNYTSGFTITFMGNATGGLQVQPAFVLYETTLENGSTPITPVIAITQAGVDQANVTMTAVATGPTTANAYSLTTIVTPITGLSNVLSIQDAIVGQNVESDNAYRARLAQEHQTAGAGTLEAIRSKLEQVTGVTAVIMFENTTDVTNSQGLPPHSFEAVVQGGSAANIAETIWLAKPAGIATFGGLSYVITDSQGQPHTIYYSTPTAVPIYIILNLTVNSNFPANGAAAAAQALVTAGNALGIGTEVVVSPYLISSLASIPGIETVQLLIGTAPDPTMSNNIEISSFQVANFDTSRVVVNT